MRRATLVAVLRAAWPSAELVALAVNDGDDDIVACAEAGVAGYVSRGGSVEDLVSTIAAAACGEVRCTPRAVRTLFRRLASLASSHTVVPDAALTAREREIAALLVHGLCNKEIGERLHIELATVKHHVHHILVKLQVRRRGAAVARLRVDHGVDDRRSIGRDTHDGQRAT
jgi:DNA-binding NarL/FixJ family response regulator